MHVFDGSNGIGYPRRLEIEMEGGREKRSRGGIPGAGAGEGAGTVAIYS